MNQMAQSPNFKLTREMSIEGATKRSPNQKANQVYNSSVVIKNGFDRHSPTNIKPYSPFID